MSQNTETIEGMAELDELLANLEPPGMAEAEPAPLAPEKPEPVGYVTRELEGPDGSIVRVEVPVYAASEGQAPDTSEASDEASDERDPDAAPPTEDLDTLLAAEDADDD